MSRIKRRIRRGQQWYVVVPSNKERGLTSTVCIKDVTRNTLAITFTDGFAGDKVFRYNRAQLNILEKVPA